MSVISKPDPNAVRTAEQNDKLHAMCRDFSRQSTWAGMKWDVEGWKRIFLGAKCGQAVGPNPFGHGVLVINTHRSRGLTVEQMAELLGEIEAHGAEIGIEWSDDEK
jgi:hypothetical protein